MLVSAGLVALAMLLAGAFGLRGPAAGEAVQLRQAQLWRSDSPHWAPPAALASADDAVLDASTPWSDVDLPYGGDRAVSGSGDLAAAPPEVRWFRAVVPPEALPALPALCKGLLYDLPARRAAMALLGDGNPAIDREALREAACQHGLSAVAEGWSVRELAQECLRLARQGLDRLAAASDSDHNAGSALDILSEMAHGERPEFWQVTRQRLQSGSGVLADVAQPAIA